jgi:transposase
MQITTLGIDVAKHVFQLHGVDTHGNVAAHVTTSFTPVRIEADRVAGTGVRPLTP